MRKFRARIIKNCNSFIYDLYAAGTWRQQVAHCIVKSCAFWGIRAKPTSAVPESTLRWHGVDLAEFHPLITDSEDDSHE